MAGGLVPPGEGEALVCLQARRPEPAVTSGVTEEDHAAAGRIRHAGRQGAFLAGRSLLRAVLSAATGIPRDAIAFVSDDRGVLSVAGVPDAAVRFNLSHGEHHDIVAVTRGIPVGIDIEGTAPPDRDAVAESVMTDAELAAFRRIPAEDRDVAFLRLWTRKEAVLKAAGTGFLVEPRGVHVGVEPVREFRPAASAVLPGGPWFVGDVDLPETACALAVDRPSVSIRVVRV